MVKDAKLWWKNCLWVIAVGLVRDTEQFRMLSCSQLKMFMVYIGIVLLLTIASCLAIPDIIIDF